MNACEIQPMHALSFTQLVTYMTCSIVVRASVILSRFDPSTV